MITIKELAQKINVAPSTISNVLNGSKYVSKDVQEKVLAAVREYGYRPNLTARSLKTKNSKIIGVMIPRFDAFFSGIMNALENRCYEKGYSIIVNCSYESKIKEKSNLEMLIQHGVDGLIMWSVGTNCDVLKTYAVPAIVKPFNILKNEEMFLDFPAVSVDNEKGAYLAVSHLIERGCRKIVCLNGRLHVRDYWERSKGYERALQEHDLPIDPMLKKHAADERMTSAKKCIEEILENRILFDGVFATSDFYALGALQVLQDNSIHVPNEVKLIGFSFNVAETSDFIIPKISTVTQQQQPIGETCVDLLETIIQNTGNIRYTAKHSIILTPELVIRETT